VRFVVGMVLVLFGVVLVNWKPRPIAEASRAAAGNWSGRRGRG